MELIDFYGTISTCGWQTLNTEALKRLESITDYLATINRNVVRFPQFHHLCTEVNVLVKAFKLHEQLLEVSILDTVIGMRTLKAEMDGWLGDVATPEETTKRSFFSFGLSTKGKSTCKMSLVVRWFFYLYSHLMAKTNLYFHLTMINAVPNGEFRAMFANTPLSFLHLFQLFARRCNPVLTALIMNRMDVNEPFFGFRYHRFLQKYSPDYCKPITGINGKYPPLAYFPHEKAVFDRFHPEITSFIQDICVRGDADWKLKFLYDPRSEKTFFTACVEKRLHIAVVFEPQDVRKKMREWPPSSTRSSAICEGSF
ncbi:hypothetical protein M3Y99_00057700 [Aphelenchoides fujianensis]|nr:hypothetical protein M3Y99_00057700 [Aphelenchoides fujianensis]